MSHPRPLALLTLCLMPTAHAAHPLITEDTGTQGQGHWQLEVNAEQTRDKSGGIAVHGLQPAATLTYGAADPVDLQITTAYLRQRVGDVVSKGKLDTALDIKWRFYENGALSLALKPGVTLPTGREDQGLGSGRTTWGSLLILSYQQKEWEFNTHGSYRRNRNARGEREGLKHISAAVGFKPSESLKLVVDFSRDTNPDTSSDEGIRQTVAGVIYSVTPDIDLDLGLRRGNVSAIDRAVLFGATLRW